jgi:cytochrome c oxidase subunit 3
MSAAQPHGRQALLLRPAALVLAARRLVALFLLGLGAALWMNAIAAGPWLVLAGFAVLLTMMFGWFGTVIAESEKPALQPQGGHVVPLEHGLVHLLRGDVLQRVLRRALLRSDSSVPDLGSPTSKLLLWPDFVSSWPTRGPYGTEQFTPMGAIGVPLLNTIILLTSGFTLTIAHHAIKTGHRAQLKIWLFATIVWASRSWDSRRTSTSTRITPST